MTTPQQDLLFKAAFLQDGMGLAAWQAWRAWVDLDDILDPGSYRLLPQLYRNLQKLGVDDPLMLKLKGLTKLQWSKNQLVLHRLKEINRRLRQAGIWPIISGSVGLALSGQADVPLNPPYYYDLLVRKSDAMVTVGCLQEMGLRRVNGWQISVEAGVYERQGSCLLQDMQGSRVHLFWGLFWQQSGPGDYETGLWERARMLEWNGDAFHVPGLEDQLLFIAWKNTARGGSTSFLQAIDSMLAQNTRADRLDGTKLRNLAERSDLTLPLQHILGYIRYMLGENQLPPGLESVLKWPCPAREQLAYWLNFFRLVSWEDLPPEWWFYLRENSTAPRLKKYAGFARLIRGKWQWRYMWQVPILGIAWVEGKVLYGADQ